MQTTQGRCCSRKKNQLPHHKNLTQKLYQKQIILNRNEKIFCDYRKHEKKTPKQTAKHDQTRILLKVCQPKLKLGLSTYTKNISLLILYVKISRVDCTTVSLVSRAMFRDAYAVHATRRPF